MLLLNSSLKTGDDFMKKYINDEFNDICFDILNLDEFKKLKNISRHGISRYNHCLRVAYFTYKVTKLLHLNYYEATRAALLHDFFTDEVDSDNSLRKLQKHPLFALENAKKYFDISLLQEDIIVTHMFPITLKLPKYLESWAVDLLDDIAAVYERYFSIRKQLNAASIFIFLVIINYIKIQ